MLQLRVDSIYRQGCPSSRTLRFHRHSASISQPRRTTVRTKRSFPFGCRYLTYRNIRCRCLLPDTGRNTPLILSSGCRYWSTTPLHRETTEMAPVCRLRRSIDNSLRHRGHPGTRTRWPLGICRAALRRISCARNVTVTEAIPVIIGGAF